MVQPNVIMILLKKSRIQIDFLQNVISIRSYCTKSTKESLKPFSQVPKGFGLPFIGTLPTLLVSGGPTKLHEFIDDRHKQFGPIFKEHFGPIKSVFVCDPNEMRKIVAKEGKYPKHVLPESWTYYNQVYNFQRGIYFMDGEEWLKLRRILNPLMFKSEHIEKIQFLCEDMLTETFDQWTSTTDGGIITDLNDKTYELSIAFMVAYLLGTPFKDKRHILAMKIRQMSQVMQNIFKCSVQLSIIQSRVAHFLKLKVWKNFADSVQTSSLVAKSLVQEILNLNGDGLVNDLVKHGLSVEEINRIIIDFIIAAGDTSAITTQWTLYLLGKHVDVQQKLYEEMKANNSIDSVMLKNILKESMRLYPIAPFITRYLPQDTEICGYMIPAGELVSMSLYTSSRSEKYFPCASKFDPSRWDRSSSTNEYKGVTDPYATLPYGMGARSCIGRKFSQGQLLSTFSKIVMLYRFEAINQVDMQLNMVVTPNEPIRLVLGKR